MMAALRTRLANSLMRQGNQGEARRFAACLADPAAAQQATLQRILQANAKARYGQTYGFGDLDSAAAFQNAVPIVDYDTLVPLIESVMIGQKNVLTTDPVLMLEKSSGSTAASKYIPYTASLRREFHSATSAWLYDLFTRRPKLCAGGSYWSISPVVDVREVTAGGLKVGFEDDTEYFGTIERWVLGQLLLVPADLRRVSGMMNNRYVTLRYLLDRDDLGLISVWNPSFLTLLVQEATTEADRLIRDLREGTLNPPDPMPRDLQHRLAAPLRRRPALADKLAALLRHNGKLLGTDLWPNLQLISCWTSGIASRFLPEMTALFPDVEIQGKGLLATEGVVSFPLLNHPGSALSLRSHFYEFLPLGVECRPLLAHELTLGERYTVLMTTGGGLYRYALHDVIEVVGSLNGTPLIDFVGKDSKISDVVGEKLNELHVGEVLSAATADLPVGFVMLAPEWGQPPAYTLFIACVRLSNDDLNRLVATIETRLRHNHHYAYARDLRQLGPLSAVRVGAQAPDHYLQACEAMGQKAGDIKPTYLHKAFGWRDRFHAPTTKDPHDDRLPSAPAG
ncbi:MAG: GH3 auxin-responsive promoter family protein [Candidatus Sericytochromatia bacterium]|nr:GH3 auxin-responsive promoter family protein [Candidatus Sericytochromatia bacterium]